MTEFIDPLTTEIPDPNRHAREYAIYGALFGLAFPFVATSMALALARLPASLPNILSVHGQPLMWIIDTAPFFLGAFAAIAGRRQDELEEGNLQLRRRAAQLGQSQITLQRRATDRARELEERDRMLRSAVRSTRKITQIHDLSELATTAVRLVAESVDNFYVDLYVIDQRRADAVLTASSQADQGGNAVLMGIIPVGDQSIVGQVAASGEAGRDNSGPAGPELGLPLLSRGRPLGVLHFRAANSAAQLPADTEVLQLVADQLASALETARLFNQARDAVQQLQTVSGRAAQVAWRDETAPTRAAYEYTPAGVKPAQPGSAPKDGRSLRIPLELRGQRIGSISVTRRGDEPWTDVDRDLAQKTADQVALALENVRLLEETRERALQEQILSEFSARLGQAVDLDSLLQTAVRELATLPEVVEASIVVNPAASSADKATS